LIYVLPWVRRNLGLENQTPEEHQNVDTGIHPKTLLEGVGQFLALVATPWIMFDPRFGQHKFFLGLLPVVWIAMRFGTRGAAVATLALNFGVMVAMRVFPPAAAELDMVGLLMLVVSAVGLLVGAAVSERDRISRELTERTSYLDSVIDNSPFGVVVLDGDGRVKFVNRAFEELTFTFQKELVGNRLDSLFSPDVRSDMPDQWCTQAAAGHKIHHTFTWGRKDGSIVDLQIDAVPLTMNGIRGGAYVICKDISQEIRAADAERKHTESLNRLVCELEVRTSQMTVLNEMASLLECCTTLAEAGEVTSQCVIKLFPEAVSGAFFMSEKSSWMVETVSYWGTRDAGEVREFGLQDCWALRRGRPHWSARGLGLICQHVHLPGRNRFLRLPLSGKEGSAGILQLEFAPEQSWMADSGPSVRQQAQESLAATVTAQLEHSIASLKLREALRDQSIRDPLTGLYNRRFMEESLEREVMRASRNGQPLSLLFLDLDHFKRFNDTFGHDAGDFVLRTMANVFRDFFRGNNLICRYGGEEFAIGLPECTAHDAAARADELRARVRSTPLKYEGKSLLPVTLSIGIAAFPENGPSVADLLRVADDCLYRSKSGGRDTTTHPGALAARI
jgi:diguanylate cyclase (GGDEF)-like protein/PAS domain S-box-containing protein